MSHVRLQRGCTRSQPSMALLQGGGWRRAPSSVPSAMATGCSCSHARPWKRSPSSPKVQVAMTWFGLGFRFGFRFRFGFGFGFRFGFGLGFRFGFGFGFGFEFGLELGLRLGSGLGLRL